MNVTGKLVEIFETVKIKESFQKREFVLEYSSNPKYPELVKFEVVQDKCSILDNFKVGQEISVEFDLRGRKWIDQKGAVKYFNTLQAWRINPAEGTGGAAPDQNEPPHEDTEDFGSGEKDGGLPF